MYPMVRIFVPAEHVPALVITWSVIPTPCQLLLHSSSPTVGKAPAPVQGLRHYIADPPLVIERGEISGNRGGCRPNFLICGVQPP